LSVNYLLHCSDRVTLRRGLYYRRLCDGLRVMYCEYALTSHMEGSAHSSHCPGRGWASWCPVTTQLAHCMGNCIMVYIMNKKYRHLDTQKNIGERKTREIFELGWDRWDYRKGS